MFAYLHAFRKGQKVTLVGCVIEGAGIMTASRR